MMSIKTASQRLSISEDTLRAEIEAGNLPAFKVRRVIRIREDDIQAYLNCRRIVPRSAANDNRKKVTGAHKEASQKLHLLLGGKSC